LQKGSAKSPRIENAAHKIAVSRHTPHYTKPLSLALNLTLTLNLLTSFLSLLQNFPPMAAKSITPDAVSMLLANPSPDSSSDLPDIVVQVVDIKPSGNRYMFVLSNLRVSLLFPFFCSGSVISCNFFFTVCILCGNLGSQPVMERRN